MDWRPEEVFQLETPPAYGRISGEKVGDIITVGTQLSAQNKDVEGPMTILKYVSNGHRRVFLVENIARSAQTYTRHKAVRAEPSVTHHQVFQRNFRERGFKGKVH